MFPLRNEGLFFWDLLGRILKKQDWFDVNIFKLDYWTCQFLLGFSFNNLENLVLQSFTVKTAE